MTVYYGNTKIGNIYYGGTKVNKVYYGNTLVYSSGLSIWKFTYASNNSAYLIGDYSTSGVVEIMFLAGAKIESITGTLGAAGSKIKPVNDTTYSYYKTYQLQGLTVYEYTLASTYGGYSCLVYKDSKVGDTGLASYWPNASNTITSVSGNTMVFKVGGSTSYTATRDTSYLAKWTTEGFVE